MDERQTVLLDDERRNEVQLKQTSGEGYRHTQCPFPADLWPIMRRTWREELPQGSVTQIESPPTLGSDTGNVNQLPVNSA
jgi:hypothetical protein